jgi:hypothetical protein
MSSNVLDSNIKKLSKYDKGFAYNGSPISTRNSREYYKNGNVKANITVFTLDKPYEVITVRNKDYYLYKENYQNAQEYLIMLHKAYKYKNDILKLFKNLSNYHFNNNFITLKELEQREKGQLESTISKRVNVEAFNKRKPLMIDSKYKFKKSIFSFLKNKKKCVTKLLESYKIDLNDYYREMKKYEQRKLKLMTINYEINSKEVLRLKKIEMISNKYSSMKQNYVEFIDDVKIDEYLKLMLAEQSVKESIYESLMVDIECYLDLKAIILDLEIPRGNKFPKVKDHRIIRKNLIAKEIKFTNREFEDIISETLLSYVLYYVKMVSKIDIANKAEKLFVNLYASRISKDSCVSVLEIDLSNVGDYLDDSLTKILRKISGESVNYKFNNIVLPIKKGGM